MDIYSIDPNEDGIQETETCCYLEFDNVTFVILGKQSPVLHNISFTAVPGETIALSVRLGQVSLLV